MCNGGALTDAGVHANGQLGAENNAVLLPPGPARREGAEMKLQLDKPVVGGTKATRGRKHGTPRVMPIRAQGGADKTHMLLCYYTLLLCQHRRAFTERIFPAARKTELMSTQRPCWCFEAARKSLSRTLNAGVLKLRCRRDRMIRFWGRRLINQPRQMPRLGTLSDP